jgi:hypothetical protein
VLEQTGVVVNLKPSRLKSAAAKRKLAELD